MARDRELEAAAKVLREVLSDEDAPNDTAHFAVTATPTGAPQ